MNWEFKIKIDEYTSEKTIDKVIRILEGFKEEKTEEEPPTEQPKNRVKTGGRKPIDWEAFDEDVNAAIDRLIKTEMNINMLTISKELGMSYCIVGKKSDFVKDLLETRGIEITKGSARRPKKKESSSTIGEDIKDPIHNPPGDDIPITRKSPDGWLTIEKDICPDSGQEVVYSGGCIRGGDRCPNLLITNLEDSVIQCRDAQEA